MARRERGSVAARGGPGGGRETGQGVGSARANANIKSNISRAVRGRRRRWNRARFLSLSLSFAARSPWFYLFLI